MPLFNRSVDAALCLILLVPTVIAGGHVGISSASTTAPINTHLALSNETHDIESAVPIDVVGQAGYKALGCWNETLGYPAIDKGYRAIGGDRAKMSSLENMTTSYCLHWCKGSHYVGTQYGGECWCGDKLSPLATELDPNICNMPCLGDNGETCGGRWAIDLYESKTKVIPSPPESTIIYPNSDAAPNNAAGAVLIGSETWTVLRMVALATVLAAVFVVIL